MIERRLEEWKRRLLDLSGRNPLLYFGRSRRTAVQITSPSTAALCDRVLEGKKLRFPEPYQRTLLDLLSTEDMEDEGSEVRVRPGDLETSLDVEDLQRKLSRLRAVARTSIEEQGINTLYLAVGMLEWRESESTDERVRSPLVLIPVTLKYERNRPFVLEALDEDASDNAALGYLLELDFHLQLPDLADPEQLTGEDALAYLVSVERLVANRGWRVLSECWLSTFSFESLVLYRDIEDNAELYCGHPVLQWLAGDAMPEPVDVPDLSDPDSTVDPGEVFPVLDADDSELEVILRARSGQNLVVHGPPGTGKSQTIANLIAQSVRDGKTVLFVSRKMAALEVVYDRLKRTGLEDICLEVHSHRSNKKDVIRRLNESSERGRFECRDGAEEFERLSRLRDRLNAYSRALRRSADGRDRSAYQMYGVLAKLWEVPSVKPPVTSREALELSAEREEQLTVAIRELADMAHVFEGMESHPWRGAAVRRVDPQYRLEFRAALEAIQRLVAHIQRGWEAVADLAGVDGPSCASEVPAAAEMAQHLTSTPCLPRGLSGLNPDEIATLAGKLKAIVERWRLMVEAQERYRQVFSDQVLDLPVSDLEERYRTAYRRVFRVLMASYRRDATQLRSASATGSRVGYGPAAEALGACVEYMEHRRWLESQAESLRDVLGKLVEKGADSSWQDIQTTVEWIDQLLRMLDLTALPAALAQTANGSQEALRRAAQAATGNLKDAWPELEPRVRFLVGVFPEGLDQVPAESLPFPRLLDQIASWLGSIGLLDEWADFRRALDRCEELGLSTFIEEARGRGVPGKQLPDALRKALASAWVAEVHNRVPVLGEFNPVEYDRLCKEFRDLDVRLRRAAVRATLASATAHRPETASGTVATSEVGILRRQGQLQRRHLPLRRLFSAIPTLLPTLKPCLLMSPLSVASYLPPNVFTFDLVIFDEASQIPPEEAIGAIVRGRQVVVAGDEKQLPPTSFFRAIVEDEAAGAEEEENLTPLTDSILEECVPLFPEAYLLWHYRSKHESLIAFSNREFYDQRLITFPSPDREAQDGGVSFTYVPDGVFDGGASKTRTNRVEARQIAEMVIEHLRRWPTRSLGIITMSIPQQEAVERELFRLRSENPDLEEAFAEERLEHFFVKNLERVQGDERDSIIISLGYGRYPQGTIHMRFGPLSSTGGQRRLNVAVTRGKVSTALVSSLLPHDLDLSRLTSGSQDVAVLQRYIGYAANGGRFPPEPSGPVGEPESEFEEAVLERLRKEGLELDPQVGASSFRIDMAIRHPDRPGRYILGIECDGATFHRTKTARERDRLRQEVLEGLGWRIFRIWSPDWLRDPSRVVSRITGLVNELRHAEELGMPAANPGNPGLSTEDETVSSDGVSAWMARGAETRSQVGSTARAIGSTLREYQKYVPLRFRSPSSFYQASVQEIENVVVDVVRVEAPVHRSAVAQRVASAFGISRVGQNVRSIVYQAIQAAVVGKRIHRQGEFLWRAASGRATPRRPSFGEGPRRIAEIAAEEIAGAIEWVLQQQMGMPREEVVRQVARELGYDRVGHQVQRHIDAAVTGLLRRGPLVEHGDVISLPRSAIKAHKPASSKSKTRVEWLAADMGPTPPSKEDDRFAEVMRRVHSMNLAVVDQRTKGGALWVIGGRELEDLLSPYGFKFAASGSHATKRRPAWYAT
jgi:very-short-patch-repair endonuclease